MNKDYHSFLSEIKQRIRISRKSPTTYWGI